MSKIIVYTNEKGCVSVTTPTPEFLKSNTIEAVLSKDCPDHAIIIDDSELPQDHTYFDAWELIDGKVLVNETKKAAIIAAQQAVIDAKQSADNKLKALGLTDAEITALKGVQ
jgi:hypothetical protein